MKSEVYIQELGKAINQTKEENYLLPNELNLLGKYKPYRNDETYEAVYQLFIKHYSEPNNTIDLSKVKGHCLKFHIEMSLMIKQAFGVNSILTIGYVNIFDQDFFKFEKINSNLFRVQADNREVVDIHVWLTLPSYEIIDLTFLAHFSYVSSTPEKKQQLKNATDFPFFFGSADFLFSDERVVYHPKYVGIDALRKNGFIRPEN